MLVPFLPSASPVVLHEVLRDLCGWLFRVVLWFISIPALYVGHPLWCLYVTHSATYNELLNLFPLPAAWVGLFLGGLGEGAAALWADRYQWSPHLRLV